MKINIYILLFIVIITLLNSCDQSNDNINPVVFGCTDATAFNYNSDANEDDGSCIYDYRDQYLGEWEFTKYWGVTHPYEPNSGDASWIGEITYGSSENTLFVPHNDIPTGSTYCYCYEFEINTLGEINDDTYDAGDFNYYFNGYFNEDSLYYTGTQGSPFSASSITVYGKKIN